MQTLVRRLDLIADLMGRAVSWLTLLMVIVTFVVVVLRYVFDTGWIAMQESVTYMHGMVFMLGAAYTLRHNGHVRVDIFYRKYNARGRAMIDMLGAVLLLLPMSVFILWISWRYVGDSWSVLEGSREAGGLPGVYLLKSLIVLMPTLLILQGLSGLARNVLVYTGKLPVDEDEPAVPTEHPEA